MADLSLLDVVKTMKPTPEQAALMVYSLSSHPLMAMPIYNVPGGVDKFKMNLTLPYSTSGDAYRKFGSEFNTSTTPTQPFTSSVKIAGGRVQVDRAAIKINPTEKTTQIQGQLAAQALQLTKDIFEGTGGDSLFGISSLIGSAVLPYTGQVVNASDGVLTEDIMDEAISKHNVQYGSTYIYMNSVPYRKLKKDSRGNATSSYNIQYRPEEFGVFHGIYDNIPVVKTQDGAGDDYLAVASGSPDTTTVYIVTYGPENFYGFQVGAAEVIGMDAITVKQAFDVEWLLGTTARSTRCITKITNVKNALA